MAKSRTLNRSNTRRYKDKDGSIYGKNQSHKDKVFHSKIMRSLSIEVAAAAAQSNACVVENVAELLLVRSLEPCESVPSLSKAQRETKFVVEGLHGSV